MNDFAGRVALVTGTTGIGRAITIRFAEGGAQVVACGIETSANEDLARHAKKQNLPLQVQTCDVTDPTQVQSVIAKTAQKGIIPARRAARKTARLSAAIQKLA